MQPDTRRASQIAMLLLLTLGGCQHNAPVAETSAAVDKTEIEQAVIARISQTRSSTRNYLSNTTIHLEDGTLGEGLAYLSSDGLMPYITPERDYVHYAFWDVREETDDAVQLCMLYRQAVWNEETRTVDGPWQCVSAAQALGGFHEVRDGDVLGLRCLEFVPPKVSKDAPFSLRLTSQDFGYGALSEPNRAPRHMDIGLLAAFLEAWKPEENAGNATLIGIRYKRFLSDRCADVDGF